MRGALSHIATSFLPPQGLAPSLPPVTLTASGNNSMRSTPCGVEMSLRCACQPWRSTLPLPCPCFSLPFQAPPPRGARTFLGPPPPTPPSEPSSIISFTPGVQGSLLLCPLLLYPVPNCCLFFNTRPFPPTSWPCCTHLHSQTSLSSLTPPPRMPFSPTRWNP